MYQNITFRQAATDQMITLFNSFVPSIDDYFVKVVDLKDPKAFSRVAELSVRSSISRMASAGYLTQCCLLY